MREISLPPDVRASEASSFAACVATILELPLVDVPLVDDADVTGRRMARWLGGLGVALVEVANAPAFSFPGPWIGWIRTADGARRAVVMFGVPSGVVFDPTNATAAPGWRLEAGHVIAVADVALARPRRAEAPTTTGVVESIWIAEAAGTPARSLERVRAIAGLGLAGDRHERGTGTFPSKLPGSALTVIAAEVCDSFSPPLAPDEHRRNVVVRGIDVNALVGRDFTIGSVRCRGMRLCEPCAVIQKYAARPVLRPLVHRGGIRVDILADGEIAIGDRVDAI